MQGKHVLITGATDGIGKQTAIELSRLGAMVIVHGRTPERCAAAAAEVRSRIPGAVIATLAADLSTVANVRGLAHAYIQEFPRLDVLVNNAGVYMKERVETPDGYEMTLAVNHLAPFLLTHELLPLLKKSAPARVVTVSSVAHARGTMDFSNLQGERRYSGYDAYARSKLANVLFTFELAARLTGTGVTAVCLHPGVIGTKLLRAGFGTIPAGSVAEGARMSVYAASSPALEGTSGTYCAGFAPQEPDIRAHDPVVRESLWKVSERLCGIPVR